MNVQVYLKSRQCHLKSPLSKMSIFDISISVSVSCGPSRLEMVGGGSGSLLFLYLSLGPARYLFSRFLPLHVDDVLPLPQANRCGEVVVQSLVDLVWLSISVTFLGSLSLSFNLIFILSPCLYSFYSSASSIFLIY